ncbi:S24/S26 family peptidase [Reyranella sp.]|uniref:S24/S26 family peptidase n=1 Tax=Reyranella sp. TaxID=1929291 RepID=UPI0040364729
MPYDSEQRRQALRNFMKTHNLQPKAWARAAGLSESALWPFLGKKVNPTEALTDDTYEALADAASELLDTRIRAAQLRDEAPWTADIRIESYVGAGDEVQMIGVDGGLGTTAAPPGYEGGGAVIVRGDSMQPVFNSGDLLFFQKREPPSVANPAKPLIVEVRGGPLYVKKVLKGSKRGHFHLLSINPNTPVLQDRPVMSIAKIGWVKPAE